MSSPQNKGITPTLQLTNNKTLAHTAAVMAVVSRQPAVENNVACCNKLCQPIQSGYKREIFDNEGAEWNLFRQTAEDLVVS